jgi:hypothetical protein
MNGVFILGTGAMGYETVSCMIDTKDMTRVNVTFIDERLATSNPTGLTITQSYAIYDPNNPPAGIIPALNTDPITSYIAPTASSGAPIKSTSEWSIDIDVMERLVLYTIANLDAVNSSLMYMIIDYN